MITESIDYLRNDDDWVKTLLIGGVLSLLSALVIPTFFVIGYILRVLRGTMRGDETPPVFDDWGDLAVDGLKGFVVGFVYFLVPGVVVAVAVFLGVAGAVAGGGSDTAGLFGGLVALVGALVGFVLMLFAAYITPAALANYAETDRLGAAFSYGDLKPVLFNGTYATAWLYAFAVFLVAGIVSGLLGATGVGAILSAFITFYALVAAYYIVGTAWGELHPVAMRDEETTDERATI
ncbi:Protein of unknown function [Halogranum amylolyticum]|uniref:DUF4013 domain-containing protein n=1 Tax=Halogranum amylolyticum TaxID=660520 RepID=A0A1H8S459_9EURY|nr:DUF4013 domain-containing protein [Halogranum amylolyticum]SEO73337.1 Protein of unknown function [Halogranum amylolyticum]